MVHRLFVDRGGAPILSEKIMFGDLPQLTSLSGYSKGYGKNQSTYAMFLVILIKSETIARIFADVKGRHAWATAIIVDWLKSKYKSLWILSTS